MVRILGIIFFSLLLIQCRYVEGGDESAYKHPVFNKKQHVEIVDFNSEFVFGIGSLGIVDTFLVYAGKTDINNLCYHLFSTQTGKYIKSFGQKGQGPGECSVIGFNLGFDHKEKIMHVYDLQMTKLISYYLLDVINNEYYTQDWYFPHDIRFVMNQYVVPLRGDTFLVANSHFNRFMVTSLKDTIYSANEYPRLEEPKEYINVEKSYFFYHGCLASRPDGKRFVYGTRGGCIMEIYDCSDDQISLVKENRFFKPDYETSQRGESKPYIKLKKGSIWGISEFSCTNKYIYAEYTEGTIDDNPTIAVFDWEGNPVKQLLFEGKIISVTIHENDMDGYALIISSEGEPKIHRFKL